MSFKVTDLVPFGKGWALPKTFSESINDREIPYEVEIDVALEGDRFVCESLTATRKRGGPPVTSEGIRKLPMQTLIRTAATAFGIIHRVKKNPHAPETEVILTPARLGSFQRFAKEGPTDEALEWVALVYRLAYACNEPPTKAVEEAFGLARSTAERWVSKARDLELIEIDDPRRK